MDITENTWRMFGYLKGNESSASGYREMGLGFIPVDSRHVSELHCKLGIFSLSILANRITTKNARKKIRILPVLNLFTRIVFQVVVLVAFFLIWVGTR